MDFIGTDCAEDFKAIENALKEQDRDTRHACAEAVIGLVDLCEESNVSSTIDPDLAHAACINAKAI